MKNRLLELIQERERKEARRIPLKEVADELELSERTVKRWVENGVAKFEAPIVERICRKFECDLPDLLYLEPSK